MGLLDEAIREHLELKRRRGADPTEVERLEREALGPVRRVGQEPTAAGGGTEDPLSQSGGPGEEEAHENGDFGQGEEYEPEFEYAAEPDEGFTEPEPELTEAPEPYAAESEEAVGETSAPQAAVPPPAPAPAPAASDAPPAEHQDLGVETAEYDVEAAHAEEDKDEDVLEETPEFFHDAPDHDRLWFEQRPPRDFDFDK